MFRPSPTARLLRQSSQVARTARKPHLSRRYLTTEPPHKTSRSWKNSATRWTIAVAGIYWYNTTPLFAEKPQYTVQETEAPLPTLDSLSRSARFALPTQEDPPVLPVQPTPSSPPSLDPKSPLLSETPPATQSPAELESEAASQGAFNEETGEINWDCSCLGGMAYGPCGEEFRAAFSCFVFSKEEPKGMDCVEKFKGMQTCFRAHPDEYGDQLDEDEEEGGEVPAPAVASAEVGEGITGAAEQGVATALMEGVTLDTDKATPEKESSSPPAPKRSIYDSPSDTKTSAEGKLTSTRGKMSQSSAVDEGGDLVPKAAHDATSQVQTSS